MEIKGGNRGFIVLSTLCIFGNFHDYNILSTKKRQVPLKPGGGLTVWVGIDDSVSGQKTWVIHSLNLWDVKTRI